MKAPPPHCRAIAVQGAATVDARGGEGPTPLATDDEVPEKDWVTLAAGARFVAKDPRTARETTFVGPARARACVDHAEESWLAAGTFESAVGAGESPGAEEWVVTPNAVVRYAASRLHLEVHGAETHVTVAGGVAFLWPTRATDLSEGWQRVNQGPTVVSRTSGSPLTAARSAIDRCAELARRSRDLASALLNGTNNGAPGEGGTAGDEVKDQVQTKRLARAACAMAALRLATESSASDGGTSGGRVDDGAIAALAAKLADADAEWRTLPLAQGH
jgi:hypothetical protein